MTKDEIDEIVDEIDRREIRRTYASLIGVFIAELIVLGSMFVYFNLMHGYL